MEFPSSSSVKIDESKRKRSIVITKIPQPPDGGFGWFVVLGSFLNNLASVGILCGFGFLFDFIQSTFSIGPEKAALTHSCLESIYAFMGPVASGSIHQFGCRPVSIVGGVIMVIGFLFASLGVHERNFLLFLFGYSIFGGIGMAHFNIPGTVLTSNYFEKKRAVAIGISSSGGGLGVFLVPQIITALRNNNLGLYHTMYMYASLCLTATAACALYRPMKAANYFLTDISAPLPSLLTEIVPKPGKETPRKKTECYEVSCVSEEVSPFLRQDVFYHSNVHVSDEEGDPNDIETSDVKSRRKSLASTVSKGESLKSRARRSSEASKARLRLKSIDTAGGQSRKMRSIQGGRTFSISTDKDTMEGTKHIIYRDRHSVVDPMEAFLKEMSDLELSLAPTRSVIFDEDDNVETLEQKTSEDLRDSKSRKSFKSSSPPVLVDEEMPKSILKTRRDSFDPKPMTPERPVSKEIPSRESKQTLATKKSTDSGMSLLAEAFVQPVLFDVYNTNAIAHFLEMREKKRKGINFSFLKLKKFRQIMFKIFNVSLFKNTPYTLLFLGNIFLATGYSIPFIFIPKYTEENQLSGDLSSLFIALLGGLSGIGRILIGLIVDMFSINPVISQAICLLAMGLLQLCILFCHKVFLPYTIVGCLYGFFSAGSVSLSSISLVYLVGISLLSDAYGMFMVAWGIGSSLGSPIGGTLLNLTKKSSSVLIFGSCCFFVSSGLVFMSYFVHQSYIKRNFDSGSPSMEE